MIFLALFEICHSSHELKICFSEQLVAWWSEWLLIFENNSVIFDGINVTKYTFRDVINNIRHNSGAGTKPYGTPCVVGTHLKKEGGKGVAAGMRVFVSSTTIF